MCPYDDCTFGSAGPMNCYEEVLGSVNLEVIHEGLSRKSGSGTSVTHHISRQWFIYSLREMIQYALILLSFTSSGHESGNCNDGNVAKTGNPESMII